jgi:hypothetical protein
MDRTKMKVDTDSSDTVVPIRRYYLNYFKIHFAQIILCYTFAEIIIDKLKWIQELKPYSLAQ